MTMTFKKSLLFVTAFLVVAGLACQTLMPTAGVEPSEPAQVPPTEAPTPTTAAGDSAGEGGESTPPPPADGGPCANPLYPLELDNQWVYRVLTEDGPQQVGLTVSEVGESQATLNALYVEAGITTDTTVECDQGAILNFPVMMLGLLFGNVIGSLELEHASGVFIPRYQEFTDHNWDLTWEGDYVASGVLQADIDGEIVTARLENSPVHMNWQTAGAGDAVFEAVEVPAGAFPQAIKVTRETTLDATLEFKESGVTQTVAGTLVPNNSLWFEPNVGLVKQQVDEASVKFFGISYPVVVDATIELLEFRPGE